MNCNRCGREISEADSYVHKGRIFCEDCLMDLGLSMHECDPWASYVDTRTRRSPGTKHAQALTETEQKIYELVKSKGKMSKEEVMKKLGLFQADLEAQLLTLMHSELVKEYSERGTPYLIAIG